MKIKVKVIDCSALLSPLVDTIYLSVMLPDKYAQYLSQLHNKYHKLNELLTPEIHSSLLWRLKSETRVQQHSHVLAAPSCELGQLTSHCVLRRQPSSLTSPKTLTPHTIS